MPLSPEQALSLGVFERLLRERAIPSGFISGSDAERLKQRHLLDSLRAAPLIPADGRALDLGSGSGLPGIPLAVARPDVAITLAERRRNRVAFLEAAVETLALENVTVHPGDAVEVAGPFEVCLARAFGSPARCWEVAEPRLAAGGKLLYWAGASFDPARETPPGALVSLFTTPTLANAGPIAIMTPQ